MFRSLKAELISIHIVTVISLCFAIAELNHTLNCIVSNDGGSLILIRIEE